MATVKQLKTIERKRKEKLEKEHKLINGVDYKICGKHYIYFPEENPWFPATTEHFYYNNKNSTDHLHPECKRCSIKNTQKNYDPKRHTELTNFYYHNDIEYKNRKKSYNYTDEEKARQAQWRKDNPEKCCEYSKEHRIHDITKTEEEVLLKVFNYSCAYCGMSLEEHKIKYKQKLHNDHVDHEGYNDLRNDVPACRSCNSRKHQDNMEEWYRQQEFFIEERLQFIQWWITEGYKEYIEDKLPYKILRKQNEDKRTYHFELWTVDEMRNIIECIDIKPKKKDLDISKIL